MPDLNFEIVNAEPARHAAAPMLNFRLAIGQAVAEGEAPTAIQNVALQCQVRIDAQNRLYKPGEQERLSDLFGTPERWGRTLRSMLWTHAHVTVPAFEKACTAELSVPCSFDFNVAATKYFHALEFGYVPLLLLFSGSVFYRDADGALAMDSISWNKEARFSLPVSVWQDMMEMYYPNQSWLCINRQVFEALYEYKRRHGYTGFDEALRDLLPETKRAVAS
ncbi:MAG: DUF6084 family protein [Gammaproteobacteria bacterium]